MSKVEELLEKYNPDGVPNKLLVECSLIDYGYPFTSSMFTDDSSYIPIIRIRDVKPGKASTYYMGNYSKEYIVKRGDILVGMDGEFNLEKWNDIDSLLNQRVARITEMPSKSTKGYLYHILGPIFKKIEREISGGSVKHLSVKIINSISIPLPHIKVQEEIVKILDSFTNLIDALNEELSLRQKQFEYYREKLLTFDESNYVKISSICKRIVSGGTPKTTIDRYYQGNIPWLRTEEVDFCYVYETKKHISEEAIANSSTKMIPVNCVIIAMYGATAAKCCINKIPLCTNQACCNLEIDDTLALYKFVFYNICKEYEKLKSLGEGSQNNISGQKIKDYRIPIPPLAIQQSIVEKLDAFESLISSLKEEIALRQKQYEYYREKLLNFN